MLIIAIRGGNTITQLNALKSKVSQLEESSSALDAATVKELKAAVESLQAKTANLPDNVKAELEDIVARIAVLEEGGTTSSGGSSSSSALTCKNGTCLSLQAGNTTVQETGSINISGSAKIGGSVTADLFYGDGSNLSNLTTTQLTTGTIADARLSTNVAMLGNTQTFTGQVQFSYAGTALTVSDTASIATLTVTNSASVGANLAVTGTVTAGSFARSCPTGYVPVPGNPKFGTSDFCVMQYEAKDDGSGNAVSTATGTPWVSIAQYTAEDEAQSAGGHLLTDAEWVTIAENALMQ